MHISSSFTFNGKQSKDHSLRSPGLQVATRVYILVGFFALALVAMGFASWYVVAQGVSALQTVYEDRTVPATLLGRIGERMEANRGTLLDAAVQADSAQGAAAISEINGNLEKINHNWRLYQATQHTAEEDALIKDFMIKRDAFFAEGLKPVMEIIREEQFVKAVGSMDYFRALQKPAVQAMGKLVDLQTREARREYEKAQAAVKSNLLILGCVFAVAMVVAVGLGITMLRFLNRALGAEPDEVRQVAQTVAMGDLSEPIAVRPGDARSVIATMEHMRDSLSQTVNAVRVSAEGVATASAEIAQGNHDLSARTEQQASALEETVASMEELRAALNQNDEAARQANQLAMNASTVAIKGGEVVAQVVATMKSINDSSRKIFDINSVIDGIAFQTNILALNAAVEAARAGEHGRGFAVVASEVRNLAGRSADAAKEIKSLINASLARVEYGNTLVEQAGMTMIEIVGAIRRVTDIMSEISAATSEQSAGVSQVGEALMQMDQTTQQNAALVEQMAAATSGLNAQANALVGTVAVFRLPPLEREPVRGVVLAIQVAQSSEQ